MATNYRNTSITVGGTSTEISPQREERFYLVISNDSSNDLSLFFDTTPAVTAQGIIISPGGNYIIEKKDKINVPIYGVASGAGSNIGVSEIYLDQV